MPPTQSAQLPEGTKSRTVYLALREQITNGQMAPGQKLPAEDDLAQSHGVSRVTVRRALNVLAEAGLVDRRAGSGTTVRAPGAPSRPIAMDFTSLLPQLAEIGQTTNVRLLSVKTGPPPHHVARDLGLPRKARVQIGRRVRLTQGTPFSHLVTYVPEPVAAFYAPDDLATTPLYQLIEQSGRRIIHARQTVSAALAGPQVAAELDIPSGSALLSLERVMHDADGQGVEYLSALYRPDMFRLDMTLTRDGQGQGGQWRANIGQQNEQGAVS